MATKLPPHIQKLKEVKRPTTLPKPPAPPKAPVDPRLPIEKPDEFAGYS